MVMLRNSKRKNKNLISRSKYKKTKKITYLNSLKVQRGGSTSQISGKLKGFSARGSSAGGPKIDYVAKYDKYRTDLFTDLANEGKLLDEFNEAINKTKFCDAEEDRVACFFRKPMLVQKLGEKQEGLFQKIKKRKLNSELMLVLNAIRNCSPEDFPLLSKNFEKQHQYSLARRLTVVVDLMSQKGNIKCKFAKLLIDRLRILENIIELSKMVLVIQELSFQEINSTQDYEFYYGQTDAHIEYKGTNYELVPNLKSGFKGVDSIDKFIIENDNARDIFISDFDYPCLRNQEIIKKKMPLYRSSGTNFSSIQRGMLSPFQGKALYSIKSTNYSHTEDCLYRDILIEIAFIFFPNAFDPISTGYHPDGSLGKKLLYNIEEWNKIFKYNISIFSHTWFIKFSPFVLYQGKGIISKIDYPAYEEWGNCDMVYDMLGGDYLGLELQRGKMEVGVDYLMIKNLEEGLNIMEIEGDHITTEDIESNRKLFFNRFFGSKDLFSMRHKGNFTYRTKKLSDFELNNAIGNQNIFDKHLGDLGMFLESKQTDKEKRIKRIKRKLGGYLYDALYHYDTQTPPKSCLSDIEKVYYISEKKFLSYTINTVNGHFRIQPYHILPTILQVLIKAAEKILMREDGSAEYQDTIFYDLIKLPFYDDINMPT